MQATVAMTRSICGAIKIDIDFISVGIAFPHQFADFNAFRTRIRE
jgi:hypothetical protein